MSQEVLTVAQLFSIVLAACGTPGLTFWVMKKMSREALSQIKENCKACRNPAEQDLPGPASAVAAAGPNGPSCVPCDTLNFCNRLQIA